MKRNYAKQPKKLAPTLVNVLKEEIKHAEEETNDDYIQRLEEIGWKIEKEDDGSFVYLKTTTEKGISATLRIDINREAQETYNENEEEEEEGQSENEEEGKNEVEIEADLYLHPKKGDGILFSFAISSEGQLNIISLNHLPPHLAFPNDVNNDLKNAQRFAGVSFSQLDEALQEPLYNYFQEFVTEDLTNVLLDVYFGEENKEYTKTLVALKNFVENH
eukprot:TRINITY_DN3259_c0_g1_i1.p1 TRINITY_DN3259_c0_g1~~TRINITY_DN3259_c0_g1_i1.p1  ORF type:complete len:256 (-),score=117.09 TRINITY_DN3259_c0_g1_i1:62-715(-)